MLPRHRLTALFIARIYVKRKREKKKCLGPALAYTDSDGPQPVVIYVCN